MPVDLLAGCIGITATDVVTTSHRPVSASVGNPFVVAEVTGEALSRAAPDLGRFRDAIAVYTAMGPNRLPLYLYANDRGRLRAPIFSPLSRPVEHPPTRTPATPLPP